MAAEAAVQRRLVVVVEAVALAAEAVQGRRIDQVQEAQEILTAELGFRHSTVGNTAHNCSSCQSRLV